MSTYNEVINVLLDGRPQSSPETIAKVVERLGEAVSREAATVLRKRQLTNLEAVWEAVKDQPIFEDEMRNLLKEVDRMHVLYVYSRFRNSRAVGPSLVRSALAQESRMRR